MSIIDAILTAIADSARETGKVPPIIWIGLNRDDHAAMVLELPAPLTEEVVRPGHPFFSGVAIWAFPGGQGPSRFLRVDGESFKILPKGDGSYRTEHWPQ